MVVVAAHVELLGVVGEHIEALRKLELGFTHFVVEAASQSGWNPNILTVGKLFTQSPDCREIRKKIRGFPGPHLVLPPF